MLTRSKKGGHMAFTRSTRIRLAVLGVLVGLFGLAAWSFEKEYGSGTNFMVEQRAGGAAIVYDVDETSTDASSQTGTNPVFEGSEEEAMAYIEERRSQGLNFTLPITALGLGGLLLLASAAPWRRFRRNSSPV